jgi:UDP-glucose 4-epimerase
VSSRSPSCIVLGGGSFLGTNLCRRLAASGVHVGAFGRRCLFPHDLAGVQWHHGDFSDPVTLASAIEPYEIVFHLVHNSTPQSANLDIPGDFQTVTATLSLLELCRNMPIKRVVFVSSGGVLYGPAEQIPTPETAPTEPITAYGVSKLTIEKYLALYERLHGLSFRILRVANAFGPFQTLTKGWGVIAVLIARAMQSEDIEIWGDGSVVRDYVFVDDVVDALVTASTNQSAERIFNVGSGAGRSLRNVIGAIEAQLGMKLPIKWKPGRAVDVPISILSIDRAKTQLHWSPKTSFEDGLARTIQWWRCRQSGRPAELDGERG